MPDCCDLSFVMPGYTDITCRRCQKQLSVPARILDRDRGVLYRFSCCDYVVHTPGAVQCKEHGGFVPDWQELIDWSPAYPTKKWWQFWKASSPVRGAGVWDPLRAREVSAVRFLNEPGWNGGRVFKRP